MKSLHDTYGAVITLNCFLHYSGVGYDDFYLIDMPNTWKDEFVAAKEWLKFAFHGYDDLTFGTIDILPYYNDFVTAIYNMTEDYDCIDRVVRTQSFTGSLENVLALTNAQYGAIALLGGGHEGGRLSYYLNQENSDYLVRHGVKIDNINNILFFKSWMDIDNASVEDIQNEFARYPCSRKYVEIFCHLQPSRDDVHSGVYGRVQSVLDWFINTKGYESHFLMDLLK
jgi:hypothetical protein